MNPPTQEMIDEAADKYFDDCQASHYGFDFTHEAICTEAFKVGANYILPMFEAERAKCARLTEALERIVGMTDTWTDEHGQRHAEEI